LWVINRIWPDFICHFSLFRGIHPSLLGFLHEQPWKNSDQDVVLAQRSPTKINPRLRVLQESARNDLSVTSAVELAKFGFNTLELNLDRNSRGIENLIKFGSFDDPIDLNLPKENNQRFVGFSFQRKLCEFLPLETLLRINDLRQAGYSDPHIMDTLKIPIVPPVDMVSSFIISCSKCGHMGHESSDCHLPVKVSCAKCFGLNHVARACTLGWRCKGCKLLGHVLSNCPSKPTSIWRVKTRPSTQGQTKHIQQKI
jgi:hypothetical protein